MRVSAGRGRGREGREGPERSEVVTIKPAKRVPSLPRSRTGEGRICPAAPK